MSCFRVNTALINGKATYKSHRNTLTCRSIEVNIFSSNHDNEIPGSMSGSIINPIEACIRFFMYGLSYNYDSMIIVFIFLFYLTLYCTQITKSKYGEKSS